MKRIFLNFIIVPSLRTGKMSDEQFTNYVTNIIYSMTGNANFATLTAQITALKTKNTEFAVAKGNVKHGPAGSAAEKDAIRAEEEQMLKAMAIACSQIANGDLAVFLSSGFIAREHHAVTGLNDPTKLLLENGTQETELKLSFLGDERAPFFKIWIGLDTVTPTSLIESTSSRYVLENLVPGTRYYVKVMACGTKGLKSGWSTFISRIAA